MSLVILYYHRVSIEGEVGVALSVFEKQMKFISENANVCSLDDVCEYIDSKKIPRKPTFTITFDDGCYDIFAFAAPILQKYNIPATVFVSTSRVWEGPIRKTLYDYWNGVCSLDDFPKPSPWSLRYRDTSSPYRESYMTWAEVKALDSDLIKVESHGHLHKKLFHYPPEIVEKYVNQFAERMWYLRHVYPRLKKGMPIFRMKSSLCAHAFRVPLPSTLVIGRTKNQDDLFVDKLILKEGEKERKSRIKEELATSRRLLEDALGRKVYHIAWPWGEYDEISVAMAKEVGFAACYTTQKGLVTKDVDRYHIPRHGATKRWFKFIKKFYTHYLKSFVP
ncbi:polysaccharide deacetylase family protein [Thermosulfidibacter takaii ABI70S6]|uniref:Polysaccharide deacetylase family protein n=1 Tax=Thermosulfidibacter takaii (strain DSM 17441 / JCM 13301 / NBRC 103674 / ABI70S6) TaxID=1298851 RepID=A0A0S3QU66_THET7|nr:polysaccharide deacetylase family protein [Thermosulfidibacter takaii]BAT71852.1 polysaccharide deacetylase family protein [Thermosulfidibacter takaii ABI70S6]